VIDPSVKTALIRELRKRFPRVALVHEWLTIPGGSEKVVLALLDMFPQAELFTTVYDPAPWPAAITQRRVTTSFLDRIPRARSLYPKLLPLMNRAFRSFDLRAFDLVLSSNHACAKNVRKPPGVHHVCYCHTPMRYAWDPAFLDGEDLGLAARLVFKSLAPQLRRRDRAAAQMPGGPDVIVANSTFVADRIRRYWGREAQVIHPPVDIERFARISHRPQDYYLFLGRLVPYKRSDLAVSACAKLDRPLKVVGAGRALDAVRGAAGPRTQFLGQVSDEELPQLLAGARALLFPGEEDFGMVPVEAQAAGLPVIAYGSGGVRDSVVDGVTGVLFDHQTVAGLCSAMERFDRISLRDTDLREHAARFAPERFADQFAAVLEKLT
jgi:glycosyltransferase involved in cell wall biosynthesis